MKNLGMILPLALILCIMAGCQDKEAMAELEEFRAQAKVEEQNIALVKRYYEAWNSGDVKAIRKIFSPDYFFYILIQMLGPDKSIEHMHELLDPPMKFYPDMIYDVEDIFAKGDKVVSRYIFKATFEGDIEGLPSATGKKIEYLGIEIFRVENGKIVESWDAYDELGGYQQLGFELKPKEEK